MAKITQDELSSFAQDWGGKKETDERGRTNPYTKTSDELPFSGLQVQAFIKNQLHERIGHYCFSATPDENGYYHLYGFETKAAYERWLDDPETYADLLKVDKPLPVKETSATSYLVTVASSDSQSVIVAKDGKVELHLRISSQMYNPITGTTTDTGNNVKVRIQTRANASATWQTVGTFEDISTYPTTLATYPTTLDITSMLAEGSQQVRVVAIDETANNTQGTLTFNNVIKTTMSLAFYDGLELEQTGALKVAYWIGGAVDKLLYLKIDNTTVLDGLRITETYTSETPWMYTIPSTFAQLFTLGVHKIEAYLALADEPTTTTEVCRNEIFFRTEEMGDTPYMTLQNVLQNVQPYTSAKLFEYCIFSKNATTVPMRVEIIGDDDTVYLRQDLGDVATGEKHSFVNELEVQSTEETLAARIYFWTKDGDQDVPLHSEQLIAIDNSESYAPVEMESTGLKINPRVRSNSEANPETIINEATGNAVAATFTGFGKINDLWTADSNGIKVLRVPAGAKIDISGYDVFSGLRDTASTASLSIEIDYRVSGLKNVNAEQEPILQIGKRLSVDGKILGYEKLPLKSYLLTQNKRTISSQDVQGEEDVRIHEVINILYNVGGRGRNYVRIFQDAVVQREFYYENDIFCGSDAASRHIIIGSSSADIEIYNLNVYKQALSAADIQQNYRSVLPTTAAKKAFKEKNDILGDNATISFEKVKAKGYNTLRWIADDTSKNLIPNYSNGGANLTKGTLEMMVYNADGTPNYPYCQRITHLKQKGQGTSSMTYWLWNISYSPTSDSRRYTLNSQNEWVLDTESTGEKCYFLFPNGKSGKADIKGLKNVAKANWASSMQSHKIGWCNLYTDLFWMCNMRSATNRVEGYEHTRKSTTQLPFFFFKGGADSCVFSNLMTFGAAKYDKECFGLNAPSEHYIKNGKATKWATALEGSANGAPLAMRQVPWLQDEVHYYLNRSDDGDEKNETLVYGGASQLDVDKAVMNTFNEGQDDEYEIPKGFTPVSGSLNLWQETEDTAFDPNDPYKCEGGNTIKFYRRAYNHDYLHSPHLEAINGTITLLRQKEQNGELDKNKQYWLNVGGSGANRYDLYRYNPLTDTFVNAGAAHGETADGYAVLNLMEQCSAWFEAYQITYNESDADSMNEAFIKARVQDYKETSGTFYNEDECIYDQAFRKIVVLKDNWCKNTYERLDVDGRITCDSDDNDTSGDLDNVGKSKVPYYVEEHDHCDAEGNFDQNGEYDYFMSNTNVRYCLTEQARGEELCAMTQLMMNTLINQYGSVMAAFEAYVFAVQRYFPATVYNEQGRLLYEDAAIAMKNGEYTNSTDPLSQNLGDHLHAELEFWRKRIVYMASWARTSDFCSAQGTLLFRVSTTGSRFRFKVTAHQAIYPAVLDDGKIVNITKHRTFPGETYELDAVTGTQDKDLALCGINYYSSIGDLTGLPCYSSPALNVTANRLTEFIADGEDGKFAPAGINFACPRLQTVSIKNVTSLTGAIDLSGSPILTDVDMRGSTNTGVTFPDSGSLESVKLGARVTAIRLVNMPNLATFSLESAAYINSLHLDNVKDTGSYAIANSLASGNAQLTNVNIKGVNWETATASVMQMLATASNSAMTGRVHITNTVQAGLKIAMLTSWGNIDSESNSLYVTYTADATTALTMSGLRQVTQTGEYTYTVNGRNDIVNASWSLTGADNYATISERGILEVTRMPALKDDVRATAVLDVEYSDSTTARVSVGTTLIDMPTLNAKARSIVLEEGSNPQWTLGGSQSAMDAILNTAGANNPNGSWVFAIVDGRKVRAKLDPNNHTKFIDGTAYTGLYGNQFRIFPRVYYRMETNDDGKPVLFISSEEISTKYWKQNVIGSYKGAYLNNTLLSRPGLTTTQEQTMSQFWNAAQKNGTDYGLVDYFDYLKYNALHLCGFGNANSEVTIGIGLGNAGQNYFTHQTGMTKTIGDNSSTTEYRTNCQYSGTNFYMNKLFGVEDLAGSTWEFRPNIRFEQGTAIIYEGNIVSNTAAAVRTFGRSTTINGTYVNKMVLGEYFDLIGLTATGTSETWWCDGGWAASNGQLLLVGGHANNGSLGGLLAAVSHHPFSSSIAIIGARLAFKGDINEYEVVAGAEMATLF